MTDARAAWAALKDELIERALSAGFAQTVVGEIPVCERWARESPININRRWADLLPNPRAAFPEAKRVVLFVYPYPHYRPVSGEAFISPYYIYSNRAYESAKSLRDFLNARGARTVLTERFPYKPVACLLGAGRYGRNCLLSREELGTRFAMQMLLTEAPLPADTALYRDGLTERCTGCAKCLRACPTHALDTGRLDPSRCLRALEASEPIPPGLRPMIGRNLLGCELCQLACPKNAEAETRDMPEELLRALDLKRLLAGDVSALAALIGRNYARKKRTQARACVVAANLGRADCLPRISELAQDEFEPLRVHALWAVKRLSDR